MADIVSRETTPEAPPATPLERVFGTWRVMLTRAVSRTARFGHDAAAITGRRLATGRHVLAQARSGSEPAQRRLLMITAAGAIAVGTALSAVFAPSGSLTRAFVAALMTAAWVVARYPAMRIAATRATDDLDHAVPRAWAMGALLHVASVTPEMRLVTWAAGLAISWRTLRSEGYPAREAWLISGAGYGLEAAGFILLVLVRSLRVAVLLVGGGA